MKTQTNRPLIHLTATIDNIEYLIGTLSFFNKQFSYFFSYPIEAPEVQFDLETQNFISRRDHITFHTNRMHIKHLDRKLKPSEIVDYQQGPLILNQPILTPLYVESIYLNSEICLMKLSDLSPWQGSKLQNILTLNTSDGFSLIFMLAPASHPTWAILNYFEAFDIYKSHRLSDLVDSNHRAGRINLWAGWDLVIIISPFVCKLLSPIPERIKSGRIPNYKNVSAALTNLMIQATIKKNATPKK
jgi:hypothetical protein